MKVEMLIAPYKNVYDNVFLKITAPFVLYAFLLFNGYLGINFGHHWDEWIFISFVDKYFKSGNLLPDRYIYPSLCHYLSLFAGYVFKILNSNQLNIAFFQKLEFKIFLRYVFLSLSCLSVFWVYILILKITKRYKYAFVAGLIFCASFEFSYHSRWAVSDLIATQFACLSTLILFLDLKRSKRLMLSSFVAGIAAGTKYTAGIVLINILIMLAVENIDQKNNVSIKRLLPGLLIIFISFSFAFILTTPGCVIEPKIFFQDILWQKDVYASGHYGYTVAPGLSHLIKLSLYIIFVIFSKYAFVSIVVAFLVLVGAYYAFIKKEWNVFGLFFVMALYIVFLSFFKVMLVRNVMYVLPYFAAMAAYGFFSLDNNIVKRETIAAAEGLFIILLLFSLQAVVDSSWSVYRKDRIDVKRELNSFLERNRGKHFIYSKSVSRLLALESDVPGTRDSYLMFFKDEVSWKYFEANRFRLYQTIAGPGDINFNYYPTWNGKDRIVILKAADARQGILAGLYLESQRIYQNRD